MSVRDGKIVLVMVKDEVIPYAPNAEWVQEAYQKLWCGAQLLLITRTYDLRFV